MSLQRRDILLGALGLPALAGAGTIGRAAAVDDEIPPSQQELPAAIPLDELRPGDYIWEPDVSPEGPVSVVISIPEQLVHVYRNGIRIAVSTCSTGKAGHETPTGTFVILEKDKDHRSNLYNNAPMPNMQRLTWGGIALHAGNLPGYPASHGCVRLPREFSEKLWTVTHLGTPVIVSGAHSDPQEITHPGMILAGYADDRMDDAVDDLEERKRPEDWVNAETNAVTTLVVSSDGYQAKLLQNNREIGEGQFKYHGEGGFGSQVLVLKGMDFTTRPRRYDWSLIAFNDQWSEKVPTSSEILDNIEVSPEIMAQLRAKMHPGMIMILTDQPLESDQTAEGFVIMS